MNRLNIQTSYRITRKIKYAEFFGFFTRRKEEAHIEEDYILFFLSNGKTYAYDILIDKWERKSDFPQEYTNPKDEEMKDK